MPPHDAASPSDAAARAVRAPAAEAKADGAADLTANAPADVATAVATHVTAAASPSRPQGRAWAITCALAVLCIWVSFILVARGSSRGTLSAVDIAWLRFFFSGLVALPLAWHFRLALLQGLSVGVPAEGAKPVALRRAFTLAVLGGVGYSLLAYHGFFFAPVAHAAVLLPGGLPLWSALAAIVLLGERLTGPRLLGLALIVAGGAVVAGRSFAEASEGTWRGDLLFVVASMCWALYGVMCRRWRVGAWQATVAIAVLSLVFVPVHLLAVQLGGLPSQLALAPWKEIAFQAVFQGGLSMLVAGYAFTQVVAHFGPVRTTMFTAIVPPLAALAAVPVLGEPLAATALVGLALVTLGLLVGSGALAWRPSAPTPQQGRA